MTIKSLIGILLIGTAISIGGQSEPSRFDANASIESYELYVDKNSSFITLNENFTQQVNPSFPYPTKLSRFEIDSNPITTNKKTLDFHGYDLSLTNQQRLDGDILTRSVLNSETSANDGETGVLLLAILPGLRSDAVLLKQISSIEFDLTIVRNNVRTRTSIVDSDGQTVTPDARFLPLGSTTFPAREMFAAENNGRFQNTYNYSGNFPTHFLFRAFNGSNITVHSIKITYNC